MQSLAPIGDEEQFHNLILQSINIINEGVVILNESGKIVYANDTAARLSTLSKNELTGKSINEFKIKSLKGKTLSIKERPLYKVLKEGRPSTGTRLIAQKPDGVFITIELNLVPLKINNQITHVVVSFTDITKIKEDEDKLKASEQQYKRLFQDSPDAIFVYGEDKNILFVNPAAVKTLGAKDQGELVGKSVTDIVHPDYRKRCAQRIKKIMKGSIYLPLVEEKFIRLDGKIIDAECAASLVLFDTTRAVQVVFRDITNRKIYEKSQKESVFHFRQMLEKIQIIALILDINGNIAFANDYLFELTGWKRDEVIGKNWFDQFIPENKRQIVQQIFQSIIAGIPAAINYENEILTRDGKILTISFTNLMMRDQDDNVTGAASLGQDITKRRKLDLELKESEERFRAVVETATDAIVQCRDGNVIFWNKSAERIFGYKPDEIIGKPVISLMPESFIEKHTKGVERVVTTGESKIIGKKAYEACIKRKDGSTTPIELSVAENKFTQGVSFTGILRDISDRKEAEEKLKKAYDTTSKIASTLQKSMLPIEIPETPGLEIKFYYQATGEGEVGGDFYDIFETVLDSYGILIGDVSGKGIEVATETARVKYLFRDRAFDGSNPSEVMSKVNISLARQKMTHFTALTYALYDPFSSNIVVTNAGNPFPYNSKTGKFIEISGMPVSLFENQKYSTEIIKLEKNDILVFYTDGIVEARRGKELFGEERIRQFIKKNVGADLEPAPTLSKLIQGLVEEARIFSEDHLRDDILVVGIKKL